MQISLINRPSLGIIGFGAFGRLIATQMRSYIHVHATDLMPLLDPVDGVMLGDLAQVCACDIVVLAVPVDRLRSVCEEIAPLLRPGTLVMDVGSVKVEPVAIMTKYLPDHVDLIATHPMFGPQSIAAGTRGLTMVMCPVRGQGVRRVAAFLRRTMGLRIIWATPEEHDREAAFTQGLTHLIARVLLRMEQPRRITTRSFDLMWEAVSMVRHDATGVTAAIENVNPYAADARQAFFDEVNAVHREFQTRQHGIGGHPRALITSLM